MPPPRRVTEALTAVPPEVAGRDAGYAGVDERSALLGALAQLPPKQRAVVVMRYWEDLSEAEVAEVLGCSVGTVKSQASKGAGEVANVPGLARVAEGQGGSR